MIMHSWSDSSVRGSDKTYSHKHLVKRMCLKYCLFFENSEILSYQNLSGSRVQVKTPCNTFSSKKNKLILIGYRWMSQPEVWRGQCVHDYQMTWTDGLRATWCPFTNGRVHSPILQKQNMINQTGKRRKCQNQ